MNEGKLVVNEDGASGVPDYKGLMLRIFWICRNNTIERDRLESRENRDLIRLFD